MLSECHDDPSAGHLGREKTYARIAKSYHWPGMSRDIAKYVQQCLICQQIKPEQKPPAGLMGRRTISAPWEVVAADVMGPLPRRKRGYEYLQIFEDVFTRWIEGIPLRKSNALAIIQALRERVFMRFGTPRVFLSDNGTEFKNRELTRFLKENGVQHQLTPVYHPQADPVERVNRTIKTMIRSYLDKNHNAWDDNLPEIIFAYNTAKHASTGFSPAFLNLGHELTTPHSLRRQIDAQSQELLEREALAERNMRMQFLSRIQEEASLKAEKAQDTSAKNYDTKRRDVQYNIGEKVWKLNHVLSSAAQGVSAKLAPRYIGPFTVSRKCGSNTYELTNDKGKSEGPIHVQELKPYHEKAHEELNKYQEDPPATEEPQPPRERRNEAKRDPPSVNIINSTDASEQANEPVKRKRGRPKKAQKVSELKPIGGAPSESTTGLETKRRGRPRKLNNKPGRAKTTTG